MLLSLLDFGFLSGFHCNRRCLMLLCIIVITIHWDSVDTAEIAAQRHVHIQSTPILLNLSSTISSVALSPSLSSSSTISVVTTRKYGLFYSSLQIFTLTYSYIVYFALIRACWRI